ncbi:MAG TPA: NUDIX hydrolase [Pilimelia sp.]|nr:NUDIX hydrolase [Pilimelia sp.]
MAALSPDRPVLAAGGVVWRPAPGGPETCLVHRPRYDDWSLPKGKLVAGEHPLVGAVREVAEETEVRAVPQVRLPTARYEARGRPKVVDYWLMRVRATDAFQPTAEVDDLRWTPLADAAGLVTYDHDAVVLRHAAALPAVTAVVLLVRHGYAGERDEWSGPDAVRPLDDVGLAQAYALADLLMIFGPRRLVSATPDRCQQTLAPLAAATGLPVDLAEAFDEAAPSEAAASGLLRLALDGREPVVVCSQGKLIPRLLELISPEPGRDFATPKGTGWLLAFAGDRLVGADRVIPVSSG